MKDSTIIPSNQPLAINPEEINAYFDLRAPDGFPDGHGMYVSTEGGGQRWADRFYADKDAATKAVLDAAPTQNVFASMSYFPIGSTGRTIANATGGWAVCGDFDLAGDAHAGNLPTTIGEWLDVLDPLRTAIPPTLMVDSGHGLYIVTAFNGPLLADDDDPDQRQRTLATLIRAVSDYQDIAQFCVHSAGKTWNARGTADISRVFRVVGTINRKNGGALPVRIIESNPWNRMEPSQISEIADGYDLSPVRISVTMRSTKAGFDYSVANSNPEPPWDKVAVLYANQGREAIATIERTRTNVGDGSQSAFDLALADLVIPLGWTPQETLDLLRWQRKWFYEKVFDGDPAVRRAKLMKLGRVDDYYNPTLLLALDQAKKKRAEWGEPDAAWEQAWGQVTPNGKVEETDDEVDPWDEPTKETTEEPTTDVSLPAEAKSEEPTKDEPTKGERGFPWPTMADNASFAGLAGRFVETLLPYTEADPLALLASFLTAYTIAVGSGPHCIVGPTTHPLRLFNVIVGQSAKARKGDSQNAVMNVLVRADPEFAEKRVTTGLSSGEGLIWAVRNPIEKKEPMKEKGKIVGYQIVIVDEGESDKRLLVVEPEFARVLAAMGRQGNTLSAIIRQAFDTGNLSTLTKTPYKATQAHIGITAHITEEELRRLITDTDTVNGFANRFLFICARRSKLLSSPAPFEGEQAEALGRAIRDSLYFARTVSVIERTKEAGDLWDYEMYPTLAETRKGLIGALTARGEAYCLRLSGLYALLDGKRAVEPAHLRSAYALWSYAERSALCLFGDATGDAIADTILAALRKTKEMTRTQISNLFSNHEKAGRINLALQLLVTSGLAVPFSHSTGGHPVEIWRAV